MAARKWRQRACDRKRKSSRARAIRLLVRRLPVTERVAAKHLGDLFLARLRIEHQVQHGVGGRAVVVQKRVVKNVVEDAAIHLGLAAIVRQEAVRGMARSSPGPGGT